MSKPDELTPGIVAILRQVRDGEAIDGRSWRSLEAARKRGLIDGDALTAAGIAALDAELRANVVEYLAEKSAATVDAWLIGYYERHPDRAPKRKAPAPA